MQGQYAQEARCVKVLGGEIWWKTHPINGQIVLRIDEGRFYKRKRMSSSSRPAKRVRLMQHAKGIPSMLFPTKTFLGFRIHRAYVELVCVPELLRIFMPRNSLPGSALCVLQSA
jgi:hypothetical protein